jgi:transposase
MLSKRTDNNRNQLEMVALDQLVPEDHLVRKIEQAIDFDFIYDLVKDTYCLDNGRPSIDPVVLIKNGLCAVFIWYSFHASNDQRN